MKNFQMLLLCAMMSVFVACKGESPTSPPPPSELPPFNVTVSATPTTVTPNGVSKVKWSATRANSKCTSALWSGEKGSSGEVDTPPLTADKTYTVTCTCEGYQPMSDSVTIKVQQAQACNLTAIPPSGTFQTCKADGEILEFAINNPNGCPLDPKFVDPRDNDFFQILDCGANCNSVRVRERDGQHNNTGAPRRPRIRVSPADDCEIKIEQPFCPPEPACVFVAEASKNFSCEAQTATYTFDTNRPWNITDVTNLTISGPTSGDGNGNESVTIILTSNKSSNAVFRTGTFKINSGCGGASQVATIGQNACPTTPPATCNDRSADNYGKTGSCRYSDTVTVEVDVTESFTCPDGSIKYDTVEVTGTGTATNQPSKAEATRIATERANADAQTKVPAARKQARANAEDKCPACPATAVPPSVAPITCTGTNNGSIAFTGCPGKTWVASSPNLISIVGPTSGTFGQNGKANLQFTMESNPTGENRNGTVNIDGQTVTIPQEGCATVCTLNLPPATSLISSAGKSNGSVGFTGTPGCQWTMSTTTPGFVYFEGATSGTIGPNTSEPGHPPSGKGTAQFSVTGYGGSVQRDLDLTFTLPSTGAVYHVRVPQSAWPN